MPVLSNRGWANDMKLDPSGRILAVATGTGIELFHFDGGHPITPFTRIVGISGQIVQMSWDSKGHLFGLNTSGKMHVYGVTSKDLEETSGSRTIEPVGAFVVRTK